MGRKLGVKMVSGVNEFYSTLSREYIMTVKDIFGNIYIKEVSKDDPNVAEFLRTHRTKPENFTNVYMDIVMSKNYILIDDKYFPMSSILYIEIDEK